MSTCQAKWSNTLIFERQKHLFWIFHYYFTNASWNARFNNSCSKIVPLGDVLQRAQNISEKCRKFKGNTFPFLRETEIFLSKNINHFYGQKNQCLKWRLIFKKNGLRGIFRNHLKNGRFEPEKLVMWPIALYFRTDQEIQGFREINQNGHVKKTQPCAGSRME